MAEQAEPDARWALEKAITDYAKAVGFHDEEDILTGWVIVTQSAAMNTPDVTALTLMSPPAVSAELQLGLLHSALLKAEASHREEV